VSALGWVAVATSVLALAASGAAAYWSTQAGREYRKLAAIYEARRRERASCAICGAALQPGDRLAAPGRALLPAHRRCMAAT